MYKQLDVVLMPFPFNDLTSNKVRPAVIYSNSNLKNDKICLLVTSKKPKIGGIELTREKLDSDLPLQSWVKPHRVFTIDEKKIIKKISSGNEKLYDEIKKAVDTYLKAV